MKKKLKQNEEALAYHEAGHAVAYFELGRRIRKVTIVPPKNYSGCCFGYRLLDPMADTYGDTPGVKKTCGNRNHGEICGRTGSKQI